MSTGAVEVPRIRDGTILHDRTLVAPSSDAPTLSQGANASFTATRVSAMTPARLADLMVGTAVNRRAAIVLLEPNGGDTSVVSVVVGAHTVAQIHVLVDTATAAAARLAIIAGLDPLADGRSLEGGANVARARVRIGASSAEVLVSVRASERGLAAEVRALCVNGRTPELVVRGQLVRCVKCDALQSVGQRACEHDGGRLVEVEDVPAPGGTIGAYRILGRLGEGGQGAVFDAEHAVLGRPVALKLLHRNLAQDPELVRRFFSEARAVSRLQHPGLVDVTDFGVLRDGRPYMVMERLAGQALDDLLEAHGSFEPRVALLFARAIAEALGAAHDGGVAHNDLKPSNVIIVDRDSTENPVVKLIDFGAVSALGAAEPLICGTPAYMAPERILGQASDGRADIYSLGIMLYEMLSGSRPFNLPAEALFVAHVHTALPPLTSPHGVLPGAVVRLVRRAVAKQPEARHQSAAELHADIQRTLDIVASEGSRQWWYP